MRETAISCSEPEVSESPVNADGGHLWAIVLAGGEGVRLRPLTRELYGEPRPKQYAALTGSASLLRQTLDRVGRLVPRERTVIVTLASHARYLAPEMSGLEGFHVLPQPSDRGTAAGVLLPVHFIHARDPEATGGGLPGRSLHSRGGRVHAPRGRGGGIRGRASGMARAPRRGAHASPSRTMGGSSRASASARPGTDPSTASGSSGKSRRSRSPGPCSRAARCGTPSSSPRAPPG